MFSGSGKSTSISDTMHMMLRSLKLVFNGVKSRDGIKFSSMVPVILYSKLLSSFMKIDGSEELERKRRLIATTQIWPDRLNLHLNQRHCDKTMGANAFQPSLVM